MLDFSHVISVLTLAVIQRRFIQPEKHPWDYLFFFILNFLFIFLKCVGTEAFFLCATAACLKSMFEYGSTFKLCGQSEFLPKPMVEP